MSSTRAGSSTLAGYVPPGNEARVPLDQLSKPLQNTSDSPPSSDDIDDGDVEIITWVQTLVSEWLLLLIAVLSQVVGRIQYLEDRVIELSAPNVSTSNPPAADTARSAARTASKPPSASSPSSSKRCDKCHAFGHDTSACRTADPATMRKRVARNNRIAKERRRTVVQYLPPPIPPTPSFPQAASFTSTPNSMDYATLAADATEFRRRQAQSTRDRRLAKRRPTSNNT